MEKIESIPELTYVNIYLTWTCNFRCIHCWVDGDSIVDSLLDLNSVLRFIQEAKEEGISSVRITGGEPLVHKEELIKIIEFASQLDLNCQIETNAFLFDEEFIEFLAKHKVSCGISLNGYNSEMNDNFTMKKGAFVKVVSNIKNAMQAGVDVSVITCVGKYNLNEFERTIDFILGLGVSSVKINPVTNCGRGNELYEKGLIFNEVELNDFFERYKRLRKKYDCRVFTMIPPSLDTLEGIEESGIYVCGGSHLLSYLPNNRIALCGYGGINDDITLCEFNSQTNVHEIWHNNNKLLNIRKTFFNLSGVCGGCIHGKSCMSLCKVQGLSEYGSWESPYPVCQKLYEKGLFPDSRLYREIEKVI